MRRFFRFIYYSCGILIFIIVAVIGYTQTRPFKNYLHNLIHQESHSVINGKFEFGDIKGNLIAGFSVGGIKVGDSTQNIISAERVEVKYDIFGFIIKRVGISNAKILNPKIHIYRSTQGSFNIENLLITSAVDTTPSDWTINIKRVELANAEIVFTDSLLLMSREKRITENPPEGVIDYARVHLKNVTLVASALIDKGKYSFKIRDLSFRTEKPDFILSKLSGDFILDKNEVSAKNFIIVTKQSHLRIDADLKDIDITNISRLEELENKEMSVSLLAHNLETSELKQFLYPWVDFLDKSYRVRIKAEGKFGNFYVDQLSLQLPQSIIQLQGQIKNLHKPKDLELNISGVDNFVNPQDLLKCLPGLNIPDLKYLGTTSFAITYNGRPLDFNTQIKASTAVGDVNIDGKMKISAENIIYSGSIETRSLALGAIIKDDNISSSINAKIMVDASGFNLHKMTGVVRAEIDSSSFNGLSIGKSVFIFDVADAVFRSHVLLSLGSGNYEVSSNIKFINEDSLKYSINGRIKSVDLAEIIKDKKYDSDLAFEISATGKVGSIIRSDTIGLQFYSSKFNKKIFDASKVNIIHNIIDNANSYIKVTSEIADLDVQGNFSPNSFIYLWDNSYRIITEAIAYRINSLDPIEATIISTSNIANFKTVNVPSLIPFDAKYKLSIKNLKPFGIFLHLPIYGNCLIEGNGVCDASEIQLNGKFLSSQFGYQTEVDILSADSIKIQYHFAGIKPQGFFDSFKSSLETKFQNLWVNNLLLNHIDAQLLIESNTANINVTALIDSTAHIKFGGGAKVNTNLLEFHFPELNVEFGNYIAKNVDTIKLAIGKDGYNFKSFKLEHESEEAVLSGYFRPNGNSEISFALKGFLLSDLKRILHRTSYATSSTQFGGLVDASIELRGNLNDPKITLDFNADGVRAEDVRLSKSKVLGKINSRLYYNEHLLNIYLKFFNQPENIQTEPYLMLVGSLPFDVRLAREAPRKLEGEVELLLQSTGFNLEFLDPFIPELSILSGTMTCDMRMKGLIDAPSYEGQMSIRNTNLIFNPNGIQYILNGNFVPDGDQIRFENFTIQNARKPRLNVGTMKITGGFTLHGLKLNHFDIKADGDLTVMTEDKRIIGQKLYGDLFVAAGKEGLLWQGNLDASHVRGQIFLKYADLVLPPEREAELIRTGVISVIFNDDTSKQVNNSIENKFTNNSDNRKNQANGYVSNKFASTMLSSATTKSSFLDGINYDLSIETQGTTTLRFVFSTQTSEELYADLQGRLNFNKTTEISRITGQVHVGARSYYNFIKKFDASGKILFTGDILNPELDVEANYQGTRDTAAIGSSSSVVQIQSGGIVAGTSSAPQVLVTLKITGTRNEPKTKIILQTKGFSDKDWVAWKEGDDEANAISYIITGQFRNELTDQQRMGLIGTNLGFALASSMVMGPISEAARRATYGVIQSVDVLYYGGQMSQSTDLRLTGQVGEAVIRAGGRVLNDIGNANVSVELPFSAIVNSERYRNLILTLERRVEGVLNTTEEQRRASNGARLFYRIIF